MGRGVCTCALTYTHGTVDYYLSTNITPRTNGVCLRATVKFDSSHGALAAFVRSANNDSIQKSLGYTRNKNENFEEKNKVPSGVGPVC